MSHFLKLGNKRGRRAQLEKLQESGVRVRALEDKVEIHPAGVWLWSAFEELATKRIWNEGGPLPIQTSEIYAYAKYNSIPPGVLREDLMYIVSLLDIQYITHVRAETERKNRKEAVKAKARGRASRRPRRRARRR